MPPQATIGVRLRVLGRQALKQVKTLGGRINQALGKIRPIASMIGGVGGVYLLQNLTRKTIQFDMALSRMSIQAHKSKGEQAALRAEMMNVAEETGIAKEEIAAAGQSIIDATGDFDFMRKVLKDVAVMSQVTGSDMAGMGNVVSDLKNLFGLSAEEATAMMRVFTEQGEQGKWTLVEMARTMPKVLAGAKVAKAEGAEGLRHVGAEMQVWRRGFATAEEAATSYKATVARLANESKKLEGRGVKVFEDDDPTKMRKMSDILTDIFENVGQDAEQLVKIFGTENIAGVSAMQAAYEDGGRSAEALNKELEKFKKVTGESARMEKDLARIQGTTGGKLMTFQQKLDKIFDDAFMENVDDLAGYLPELTKVLKFVADNKTAILAFWAAQKLGGVGGVSGAGGAAAMAAGGAAAGGGGAVYDPSSGRWKDPKTGKFVKGPGGAGGGIVEGVGLGLGASEVSKGHGKATSAFASEIAAQEQAMGRSMSMGEKIGLLFKGLSLKPGTGAPWESPTEQAKEQIDLSLKAVQAIEEAVRNGAKDGSRAGIKGAKIFIPNPMKFAGGTQGKPVHGG